ncbi:hypothetical protein H0H87_008742 [Tephrocybe sp. NHM501043]|nr:hypothetical protein H0H87_008742 [Tephrocybe sp. NHM501043]
MWYRSTGAETEANSGAFKHVQIWLFVVSNDDGRSFFVTMTTLLPPVKTAEITSEVSQAEKEVQNLKAADPFNVVEMTIEVAVERTRTFEALKARDATVQRLVEAHEIIRQKSAALELLQQNLKSRTNSPFVADSAQTTERSETTRMKDEIAQHERTIVEQRIEIRMLKEAAAQAAQALEISQRYSNF